MTCTINASPTNGLQMTSDGSGALQLQSNGVALGITSMTAQNTTSGTSIDFTGIPAGVKRITVMLNNVSSSGSSTFMVRIGAGSVATSGYSSQLTFGSNVETSTTGFIICSNIASAYTHCGQVILCNMGSNVWTISGNVTPIVGGFTLSVSAGAATLSGTLDRVRLTTVNGTDTFDAGSVNVLYEVW